MNEKSKAAICTDEIEAAVYAQLKPLGFRKYGRTLRLALSTSFLPSAMLTKAQQPSPTMTAMASATTVSGNTTVLAAFP